MRTDFTASIYLFKERKIEKGRGIAFIDQKGVRIKGSEVGYSLSKIEKILGQKPQRIVLNQQNQNIPHHSTTHKIGAADSQPMQEQKVLNEIFDKLFQAEQQNNFIPFQLLPKKKKKKQGRFYRL